MEIYSLFFIMFTQVSIASKQSLYVYMCILVSTNLLLGYVHVQILIINHALFLNYIVLLDPLHAVDTLSCFFPFYQLLEKYIHICDQVQLRMFFNGF